MPKKLMSKMTAGDFVWWIGAMGGNYGIAAGLLGLSPTMISLYANGKRSIPVDVTVRMSDLTKARIADITNMGYQIRAEHQLGDMVAVSNQMNQQRSGRLAHMCNRMKPEDSKVYPAYRMHPERFRLFAEALAVYHASCVALRKQASDPLDIKMIDRELADLRCIADNTKGIGARGAPYDMLITHSEWNVVSRALRHENSDPKYALYQHWRHHKGTGFPRTIITAHSHTV